MVNGRKPYQYKYPSMYNPINQWPVNTWDGSRNPASEAKYWKAQKRVIPVPTPIVAQKIPVVASFQQTALQGRGKLLKKYASKSSSGMGKPILKTAKLKKGALHKQLGIPANENIPISVLKEAVKSGNPILRKRAQFALNIRKK